MAHVPALDGLRGVAVVLVLAVHTEMIILQTAFDRSLVPGGFLGVDLFFVLSGFLITTLIYDEQRETGRLDVRAFLVRRGVRLLPALYAMLVAVIAYVVVSSGDIAAVLRGTRDAVLYVSNWARSWDTNPSPYFGHLWSLAIEEQFYIVWAIVAAIVVPVRRARRVIAAGIGVLIVAVMVQRARLYLAGEPVLLTYVRTDTRADALLIGALAAHLRHRWTWRPDESTWAALVLGSVAVALAAFVSVSFVNQWLYLGGFTAIAACFAVLTLATVEGPLARARLLHHPRIQWFGRRSYGIYLWHYPVFRVVGERAHMLPPTAILLLAWAATMGLAAWSWRFVEVPAQRIKALLLGTARNEPVGAPVTTLRTRRTPRSTMRSPLRSHPCPERSPRPVGPMPSGDERTLSIRRRTRPAFTVWKRRPRRPLTRGGSQRRSMASSQRPRSGTGPRSQSHG